MANYYDRYLRFRGNGQVRLIPYLKIDKNDTDLYIVFDKSKMRMDMLSYKYYGDANYGWLILLANPSYGSMEFEIPDKSLLRIPYPLNNAINLYEKSVQESFDNNF